MLRDLRHMPSLRDSRWDAEIAQLDPRRDAPRIVQIVANHLFPLEVFAATEIGQFRLFAIPSISAILHGTREYEDRGVRRVDDTRAFLVEILAAGTHTPDGAALARRLRDIHSLYRIRNDDYLATLAVFVVDPVEFIDRWGWRPTTAVEREALYRVYRELAEHMEVRDIPPSFEALAAWRRDYEAHALRYTPANEAVSRGLLRALTATLPGVGVGAIEDAVSALLPERARHAAGLRPPRAGVRATIEATLAARQRALRRIDPWQTRAFWQTGFFQRYPSYPDGYDRMRLGPQKVLARLDALRTGGASRANG